ncbi:hypothetical protein ACFVIM_02920 [Streptomyces sp. NPDC057638]|uniref:hypothetical protein n=1 Tax=Streptomyces sp. NPDC057638 TaxID=3346190 RepID=UPI00368A6904
MTEVRVETAAPAAATRHESAVPEVRVACEGDGDGRADGAAQQHHPAVEAAIAHAHELARCSLAGVPDEDGWRISGMDVSFGLTLAHPVGAGESFAVRLRVERDPGTP